MKKIISVLLALIMAFGVCSVAFAENQISVPEGYIGIYTAEDLYNIRNNLSGKYILMNDIDLSVYENWDPIGDYDNRFCGEFDGNGYSITNLKIDIVDRKINFIGLFGSATKAIFKNVAVIECVISVNTKTDKLLGMSIAPIIGSINNKESVVSNCYSSGNITVISDHKIKVGGISGYNNGKIYDCKSEVDISVNCTNNAMNYIYAGGIAGEFYGEAEQCVNSGNITVNHATDDGWSVVGGIAGYGEHGKVKDSYNIGNISVTDTYHATVGGIYGYSGMVINCYNIGNIEINAPKKQIGGGAGVVMFWPIQIGDAPEAEHIGEIRNCYYINTIINTSNYTNSEFVSNYTAVALEDFSKQETFAGFDFENIWVMEENGYPVLKNQPTVCVEENIELVEGDVYNDKIITSEWSTTNPDVATVNENGEIVAVGVGEATITVKYAYGYTEEITVNVIGEVEVPEPQKSLFEMIVDFIKGLFERIIDFILRIFSLEKLI